MNHALTRHAGFDIDQLMKYKKSNKQISRQSIPIIQNPHRLFGIEYSENTGKASQISQTCTYFPADINIYAIALVTHLD